MKYIKKFLLLSAILTLILLSGINIAYAQDDYNSRTTGGDTAPVELDNPLTGDPTPSDPNLIIGKAINGVLGIVGSLALVMFIYGGILWMTAAGNDQRVQKGKDTLLWAIIGLIVIFSAYAIINFVLTNVIGGQSGSGGG